MRTAIAMVFAPQDDTLIDYSEITEMWHVKRDLECLHPQQITLC